MPPDGEYPAQQLFETLKTMIFIIDTRIEQSIALQFK